MVTVQITVEGLAILCLSEERGEINLLRYEDHLLTIEMENGEGSEDDPVIAWDAVTPPGGLSVGLAGITFSSVGSEISRTESDQTPINRLVPFPIQVIFNLSGGSWTTREAKFTMAR